MEAWHLVRNHPEFRKLDRAKIEGLKRELSMAVRCFGCVPIRSLQPLKFPADECPTLDSARCLTKMFSGALWIELWLLVRLVDCEAYLTDGFGILFDKED